MSNIVRSFNGEGIGTFSKWLRAGAPGAIPQELLVDSTLSVPVCQTKLLANRGFKDRYEFGSTLVAMLQGLDSHKISYDLGLWSWLAAWFFDQLCPVPGDGTRSPRKEYVYILGEPRLYYRHLVRTPWFLVDTHGEGCRFLLVSSPEDPAPLSRQSYLLDQLAARQFVIASPTLISAASRLYADPRTGRPKRGAGTKGQGSPRRLALIANQLSLTFDIRDMPIDSFMKLLPEEFSAFW
jgi:hypothetical protein